MRPVEWITLLGQAWTFTPPASSLPKPHEWVIPEKKNSVTKKYRRKCCYTGKTQEIYTISLLGTMIILILLKNISCCHVLIICKMPLLSFTLICEFIDLTKQMNTDGDNIFD